MSTQALSPDTPRTSRLPGRLMLALAVLPFLFVALWEMRAPLDLSIGDQAQYLLHARSIETGRGYTDDGYIYSPRAVISPQAYPPGLPLVIAGVDTLGGSLVVTRLLMIACAALFLYLAGRYLATRDDPLLGAASVVMCAFIPNFALYATGLYSDYAFAAAAWGCCLLADRPGEWSRGRIAGLTVLGVIAIVFRTIGIALVPALVIHQAWRTWRHREPWTRAIVPLVAWVATYVAIDQLLPVAQGYAQQITSGGADVADRKSAFWLLKHFLLRALSYRDVVSGMLLIPTRWRLVNSAYHAVALVAVVVGAIAWVRRAGVRFLFCFVVVYVGLFVLIPWRIGRYMWPLAPVVWFTALNGVRVALQAMRVDRVRAAWIPALAAAAIGVAAVLIGPEAPPLVGIEQYVSRATAARTLFQKTVFAEGLDFEMDASTIGPGDLLFLEIDRDDRIRATIGIVEQLGDLLLRQGDGQNAVLETVVVENISERRRDHAADAKIQQSPRRVLAARAAAEIFARHQNAGLAISRPVQHEIRDFATFGVVTHLVEEMLAEPGALDRLQILLGNDHVGVDIDHRQRRGNSGQCGEFFHLEAALR